MRLISARIVAIAISMAAPVAVSAASSKSPSESPNNPVVVAPAGTIKGVSRGEIFLFLGIPYARPPVGDLRWRAPEPPTRSSEVFQASHFGPTCPQITEWGFFAGPPSDREDCLYLNVFTTNLHRSAKAPVLVWLHGGGFVSGESDDYDGSRLARGGPAGPTVVVTLNYRLGLLGALSHPSLDEVGHPSGNYGFEDQQAAIRWVRRNIAAFGGDPANITLAGQSAGGLGVQAHLVAPGSRGLFQRAIIQSEPFPVTVPHAYAEQLGTAFARAAGCPVGAGPAIADCLRHISVGRLLSLQGTFVQSGPYVSPVGVQVDGIVIPERIDQSYREGTFARVPILSGVTLDEGAFDEGINELFNGPLSEAAYVAFARAGFAKSSIAGLPSYVDGSAEKLLAQYPPRAFSSPSMAAVALRSDSYLCQSIRLNHLLSEKTPLWTYVFSYREAPSYMPTQSFPQRAAHTSDLQFVFTLWHGGPMGQAHDLVPEARKLSDLMVATWTNFMYYGNPNGRGDLVWPRYSNGAREYFLHMAPAPALIDEPAIARQHHCQLWDSLNSPQ